MLNAFRHHGERDGRSAEGRAGSGHVLNAFRHHGERDVNPLSEALSGALECSTPFGITASGTPEVARADRRLRVLNAFRHHGERDAKNCMMCSGCWLCSTPFGITASGTVAAAFFTFVVFLCSTPFGITASGTRGQGRERGVYPVLNAFRHHGERDQRGPATAPARRVLNAFWHHGERDPKAPVLVWRNKECSTPFGITASGTR